MPLSDNLMLSKELAVRFGSEGGYLKGAPGEEKTLEN